VGVWTSTDPAEQFWSKYAYAGNGINPINGIDKDGNEIATITLAGIGLGILFSTQYANAPGPGDPTYHTSEFMIGLNLASFALSGPLLRALGSPAYTFGLKYAHAYRLSRIAAHPYSHSLGTYLIGAGKVALTPMAINLTSKALLTATFFGGTVAPILTHFAYGFAPAPPEGMAQSFGCATGFLVEAAAGGISFDLGIEAARNRVINGGLTDNDLDIATSAYGEMGK